MKAHQAGRACAKCSPPQRRFPAKAWAKKLRSSQTGGSPVRPVASALVTLGLRAAGGPIALIETGDLVTINALSGELNVDLTDEQLAERKAKWKGPRETIYASGALWKYAQLVGPTYRGAVTHPGGKAERHDYFDL